MSKYTPEIVKEICGYIEDGLLQKDAQVLAGISKSTFHQWEKDHSDFSDALIAAKTRGKAHHIKKIKKADQWQSSAWYLERKFPDEFAIKKEEVKQPITIQWEEIKSVKKVG